MAIAWQGTSAVISSASASSGTITWPGAASGQLLVAVFGFESVTSGPFISSTNQSGWFRTFYQNPSASGSGLEVWNTLSWSSGATTQFNFSGTYAFVGRGLVYTGQYLDNVTNPARAYAAQAWTGDNPQTPSIFAFSNELVITVASEQMASPGFGTPTGYTQRFDSARGGTLGNVEITADDANEVTDGTVAAVTWTATASSGTTKGTTGILAIKPATAPQGSGSPLIEVSFPLT